VIYDRAVAKRVLNNTGSTASILPKHQLKGIPFFPEILFNWKFRYLLTGQVCNENILTTIL